MTSVLLVRGISGAGHAAQPAPIKQNPCEAWLESAPYLDPPGLRREWARDYFQDVYFSTPLKGWAVAGDGVIASTADGGRSWKSTKVATPPIGFVLMQIGFRTPQNGWVAAEGQFFTTKDGGQTWRRATAPVTCTEKIKYVTPMTGWLGSKTGWVFKTTDGGRTWRRQARDLTYVPECFSESECIASGFNGVVLTTSDGNTWMPRQTPLGRSIIISEIKITRSGTAWAIAESDSDSFSARYHDRHLLGSDDKGKSWKVVGDKIPGMRKLVFFDDKNGIIVGEGISWTNDGGITWRHVRMTGGDLLIHGLHFVDENLGWAVGQDKTVLHTTDGGKSWEIQHAEGLPTEDLTRH
jgi:photosystem II stability/assembly factor-like uncharacterized protein